MESRYMTDLEWRICHAVNIYIYRNGKDGESPVLVHIPPSKKKNMRTVMNVIQERVKFPVGFAAFLYKMDGKRVRHPCELEMYNNYVVASNYDKFFKCAQYGRKKSPLLVLNPDSKHIRVLRQQYQSYYEWSMKKRNAAGEERPQFIYPTFYTTDNATAQDLPVGPHKFGNFGPPGGALASCAYSPGIPFPPRPLDPQSPNPNFQPRMSGGFMQPGSGRTGQQPPASGNYNAPYQPQPQQQQQQYVVNTCLVNQGCMKPNEEEMRNTLERRKDNANESYQGKPQAKGVRQSPPQHPKFTKSDIINMNVQAASGNQQTETLDDYSEPCRPISDRSESDSDENFMGEKYQDLVARFKKKMEQQVVQKATTTGVPSARNIQAFPRIVKTGEVAENNVNVNFRPHEPPFQAPPMKSSSDMKKSLNTLDVYNEEIIVLPPPPVEFRDDIIPSCGRLYSLNSNV